MQYSEFSSHVIDFIAKRANVPPSGIDDDTQLIATGIVDSVLLTELILFVEDALKCNVDIDNFKLSSFASVRVIHERYGHRS